MNTLPPMDQNNSGFVVYAGETRLPFYMNVEVANTSVVSQHAAVLILENFGELKGKYSFILSSTSLLVATNSVIRAKSLHQKKGVSFTIDSNARTTVFFESPFEVSFGTEKTFPALICPTQFPTSIVSSWSEVVREVTTPRMVVIDLPTKHIRLEHDGALYLVRERFPVR